MNTDAIKEADPEMCESYMKRIPLGRWSGEICYVYVLMMGSNVGVKLGETDEISLFQLYVYAYCI